MRMRYLSLVGVLIWTLSHSLAAETRYAFAFANQKRHVAEYEILLSNPHIDGIVLGDSWDRIEPRDGHYDWSRIDAGLEVAKKKDKKATLHLFGVAFGRAPAWLKESGARFASFSDPRPGRQPRMEPVPWDSTTLTQWEELLRALEQHLREKGFKDRLFAISLTMPVPEMNILGKMDGVSYDRASYLGAWKKMIDVYADIFPDATKLICAPHNGFINDREKDEAFYREVMDYAFGRNPNFWVFATDLTAEGSDRTKLYSETVRKTGLGYQTIWGSTDDPGNRMKGSLQKAIETGLAGGARYFEIYAADVKNPDKAFQAAIEAIHK